MTEDQIRGALVLSDEGVEAVATMEESRAYLLGTNLVTAPGP